jgi:enamine deaminase RidA (YjgF/YER057c/UK114 family)
MTTSLMDRVSPSETRDFSHKNERGVIWRLHHLRCSALWPAFPRAAVFVYKGIMPTRQNIAGTSPYEPVIGFSRAVRIGNVVHVSGTGPVGAEDLSPAEQTRTVLALIEIALAQAGATFEHVVRTRMFLARVEDWEEIGRAHGEVFGTIRPASTMVVAALLNPKWRIEIEAEAVLP